MPYESRVIADSISPDGVRLTTLEVTLPRRYLAEFNTHRDFSRNSESLRAIPTEILIERVRTDPYVPEFRRRVPGMGGGEFLEGDELRHKQKEWREAAWDAATRAEEFLHISKDDANTLIEPFLWQTIIVSATRWDNFLNLRDHEDAAIPMQRIAALMRKSLDESIPLPLAYGQWHAPFIAGGIGTDRASAAASAGICARSSYSKHNDPETFEQSVERWEDKMAPSGHWSPGEHPAKCVPAYLTDDWGNFDAGWLQLRKLYHNEKVFTR